MPVEESHSGDTDQPLLCLACSSAEHGTQFCRNVSSSKMRRKATYLGLCFACLSKDYRTTHVCQAENLCENFSCPWSTSHSKVLCHFDTKPIHCKFFLTTRDTTSSINRLSTILLWVEDPVSKVMVVLRCIADSGASHSFIRSHIAERLNLVVTTTKTVHISSFNKAESSLCNIVKAVIKSKRGPGRDVEVSFVAVKSLCDPEPSRELMPSQLSVIQDRGITLADPEAAQTSLLPIDGIIGQDCLHSLVDGESLILPGGLRLIHTIYDTYMLAGSSQSSSTQSHLGLPDDSVSSIQVLRKTSDCVTQVVKVTQQPNQPNVDSSQFLPVSDTELSPVIDTKSLSVPSTKSLTVSDAEPLEIQSTRSYNCQPLLEQDTFTPGLNVSSKMAYTTLSTEEEHITLEPFTSLETLGISPDEDVHPVMEHFHRTTKWVGDRFEVELPKQQPKLLKLDPNFPQCLARLVGGYRKRQRKADKTEYDLYNKCIEEYVERGYLEKVAELGTIEEVKQRVTDNPNAFDRTEAKTDETVIHYLPHHATWKASTGKLRVVYDGKARPHKQAYSLNECLEKGPNLMNSLIHILMRFRKGRFAAKADVEKAYLQVQICEKDRDLLRILWIDQGKVWIYRFKRLPFGIRPAGFLLAAVMLKQLSSSNMDIEMRDRVIASFYVDDTLYSERTFLELMSRKTACVESFKDAGMVLREWTSNIEEARDIFSKDEGDRKLPDQERVLGLLWDLPSDTIGVNDQRVLDLIGKRPKTKRALWSFTSKLYDPLGLISPYTVKAKWFTRKASEVCKGWDNKLPTELGGEVGDWTEDFIYLKDIRLPRFIGLENSTSERLVGFCDASITGIAACIYLVSSDGKKTISHLVKANTHLPKEHLKSRIPCLELIGAVMLANLMTFVRKSYPEIPDGNVHYFTDSADVLYWIYSGAWHEDIFIANRISTIRSLTTIQAWKHVSSARNPADIPSRGCSLEKLKDMPLYWHGPDFIRGDMVDTESTVTGYDKVHVKSPDLITKLGIASSKLSKVELPGNISKVLNIAKYGTYERLIHITTVVLKVLNKFDTLRCKRDSTRSSCLKLIKINTENSAEVQKYAELLWVQATQLDNFLEMYTLVKNPNFRAPPAVKSKFFEHKIFYDQENRVLCCGTRVQNSTLPSETVTPMLMPSNSIFTDMLINKVHREVGHQGTPQTLTRLRTEYWILQGRRAVQKVLRRCVECRRYDGKCFALPPHPQLPNFRVQRNQPFSSIGLDFMGPFGIVDNMGPDDPDVSSKVYVLILTCASTRCTHLEVTRSLALNDFAMALERFFNFRGVPNHIESDNAATFIRCNRELKSTIKQEKLDDFFKTKRINWNFYTQKSPHKGGFIERLNGIFKNVCNKGFGKTVMNFEEFRTMTTHAMAVLNDRPITYVYSDNNSEGRPLSPNMVTLGYNVMEPPHLRFQYRKDEIAKRYGEQFVELENFKNVIWQQWLDQYITGLFEQHIKGSKINPNLRIPKIGEICLLRKENTKRRKWPLCRVLGFKKPKEDGHIRECRIQVLPNTKLKPSSEAYMKLKPTVLKRSPQFLVPLEIEPHYISDDPLIKVYEEANPPKRIQQNILDYKPGVNTSDRPYKKFKQQDKPWEPTTKQSTTPSNRVLRPRSKTLGLVLKP